MENVCDEAVSKTCKPVDTMYLTQLKQAIHKYKNMKNVIQVGNFSLSL
jgi:hypothetical protein